MLAIDGKMRLTDVADTEQLLRLVQSIPSPKAEPFKLWLAEVGYERLEEAEDPEKSIDRAVEMYLRKGYSKEWVNQRLKSVEIRKDLTDEWDKRGVKKGREYAILTDEITKAWSGMTTRGYKNLKELGRGSGIFHLGLYIWNGIKNSTTKNLVEFSTIQFKVVITAFARDLKGHAFLIDVLHNLLDSRFKNLDRLFNLIYWRKVLNPENLFERLSYCCIVGSIKISMGTVAISSYLDLRIDR